MEKETILKSSFLGFNKKDVMNYVERLQQENLSLKAKVAELETKLQNGDYVEVAAAPSDTVELPKDELLAALAAEFAPGEGEGFVSVFDAEPSVLEQAKAEVPEAPAAVDDEAAKLEKLKAFAARENLPLLDDDAFVKEKMKFVELEQTLKNRISNLTQQYSALADVTAKVKAAEPAADLVTDDWDAAPMQKPSYVGKPITVEDLSEPEDLPEPAPAIPEAPAKGFRIKVKVND